MSLQPIDYLAAASRALYEERILQQRNEIERLKKENDVLRLGLWWEEKGSFRTSAVTSVLKDAIRCNANFEDLAPYRKENGGFDYARYYQDNGLPFDKFHPNDTKASERQKVIEKIQSMESDAFFALTTFFRRWEDRMPSVWGSENNVLRP
jgi:hypothetical protein